MLVACAYFLWKREFAPSMLLRLFYFCNHYFSHLNKGKNPDPHLWLRIWSWSWRSRNMRIRIPNTGRCSRLLSYSFALICWTWDVSSLNTNFKMLAVNFCQFILFPCTGVAAIVTAEMTSLPACKFQVQVQRSWESPHQGTALLKITSSSRFINVAVHKITLRLT